MNRAVVAAGMASAKMERGLLLLSAAVLFFMMCVTAIDVVMRKILPGAFPAADELTKLSLGVLVFAAMPLVTVRREHIVISLFDGLFSNSFNRAKQLVMDLFSGAILLVLAWRLAIMAQRFGAYDDRTLFLEAPFAPLAWFTFAAAVFAALLSFGLAVTRVSPARKGD
jgi:TRAP-type C4-dicarboxylate transport system permease small subunit